MSLENSQRCIADRTRGLLRRHRVTQKALAAECDMAPQALSNKLRGSKRFTLQDVARIADCFDVSTDYLLGRDSEEAVK
ncbi:helix-turn-helix domain-containing protein [Bifidobacterium pseudolongum]|uniref:helix-turn-helix domain-containing protein n=1 Tax=Bifidobacterium pseudolongum TaxID=1694 RepID=UPI0010220929|nr:helix-turn-helix transcriptional regulator [Bifidobacterium pseudolongum]